MLVAIDVGYSHTKVATDGRRAIFPSVLGEVQRAHADLEGLTGGGEYMQIETDAGAWFVGDAAIEQSGLQTRRQDRNWITSPEYLALVLTALTEVATGTSATIELVTGLPVSYYADRKALADALEGVHRAKRAGRRTAQRFDISKVLVLPQGLAALLSEAMTDQGKVRPGPIATGTVGLLDIGGHTVNVATFKELKEIARQTASFDGGVWGPLADIGKRINGAYPGLELRGHAVIDVVKAGVVRRFGVDQDIMGITREVLKPFARSILSEASQVWGNAAQLDLLLIAGGGAEIVGGTLMGEYPHAQVVTNPQWANVEGYLKFGRRHFQRS